MRNPNLLLLMLFISLFSCKTPLPPLEEFTATGDIPGPARPTATAPVDAGHSGIFLSTEEKLLDAAYAGTIEAFYGSGLEGTFSGRAGVSIYFRIFRRTGDEKGAIMISAGRTESVVKYKELIYDLYNSGYSVYVHDHRGQGLSGRMTGDPEMGYVDAFQFYVDDMKTFFDGPLTEGKHAKKYLLAHSMGGAIGVSYLEQFPGDFDAAAFCSPMLGLKFPICPLAALLAGKKPKYGPGQGGYKEDYSGFAGNPVTGSEVRYRRMIAAYQAYPQARLGGATTLWVHRSCRQFRHIFDHAGDIRNPVILFSAGNEKIVDPGSHGRFFRKMQHSGGNCEAYVVGEGLHELLMEKDNLRNRVVEATLRFYERY